MSKVSPAPYKAPVVLSPHYDDAILGSAHVLIGFPESTVLTVFSGAPENAPDIADWDARCGFSSAAEAMRARRAENEAALKLVKAQGVDLDLVDSQYRAGDPGPELRARLSDALQALQPTRVFVPLGLFHEDHHAVLEAALFLMPSFEGCDWHAYTEALYRRKPGVVQKRLADLLHRGIMASPWYPDRPRYDIKRQAVAAYASQLGPLGLIPGEGDDAAPECYWALRPVPADS